MVCSTIQRLGQHDKSFGMIRANARQNGSDRYTFRDLQEMNDLDPQAWLADVLARLPDHLANKVADLLPWNWKASQQRCRRVNARSPCPISSVWGAGGCVVIKIDVKDFESRVLRGLATTIAKSRPLIVTEMVSSHLARCRSSAEELVQLMTSQNYKSRP
jgi:hypothetical protein